jgi:8-hydroxy-5-deazaflavin:NADPH oxidoreductase
MKIGVVGGGNVGTALAKRLIPNGHDVMLSFSRDPVKLRQAAKTCGARTGSLREAVEFAQVVALAVPWAAAEPALHEAGRLDGKIVWDCTNALKPDMSGLALGTSTSGGETVQRLASGATVVKGIPRSLNSCTAPTRPSAASR